MSNLEPGCKAIVIKGEMNPNYPTNVGRIVTVIGFIGKATGWVGDDYWEVDQLMYGANGTNDYLQNGAFLQRIDNNPETIKTREELEINA